MNRIVLIASNDVTTREIAAKFFNANGFLSPCVNCDEQLLSHVKRTAPDALVSDIALSSRFFAAGDREATFSLLLAARCYFPRMPILLIGREASPELEAQARLFGMPGYFHYPLDLSRMLGVLRQEMRRVSRLKDSHNYFINISRLRSEAPELRRRGRPRKYPVPAAEACNAVA